MNIKKGFKLVFAAIILMGLFLTGCGSSKTSATSSQGKSSSNTGNSASSSTSSTSGTTSSTIPQVKIMVGGLEKIIYIPYMLAEKLGYYKAEGINVQLINESGGQSAETAVLSGQVQGAGGFYDHTLDLQSKGKYLEAVVTMADVPGEQLLVSNRLKGKVKSIADLKGLNIGVTDLGSSTNFLASFNVVKGGHKVSDYKPVPVGAGQTLIAAMQNSRIDACVTSEPTASLLKSKNLAFTLVDMSHKKAAYNALGGGYAATSLYMQTSYVKTHPDVAQKLANVYVKTLKWMSTHTPEQIANTVPQAYWAGNKQLYLSALKGQLPMFTTDGKMPSGVPENVKKILSQFKPQIKNVDLNKTYTNQFVNKANGN